MLVPPASELPYHGSFLSKLRVLLGNKFWYPKGGVETYLFELVDELAARGHEAVPFAMRHPRNRESAYERFFVDEVDYDRRDSLWGNAGKALAILHSKDASKKLQTLIDETRPDVAHLHNIYHQISPSILPVLARNGIPVIQTLHDLKLACPNYKMRTHGEICERCVPGKYYHAVLRRCVKGSAVASAVCAAEAYLHRTTGIYQKNVERFVVPSRFYLEKLRASGIAEHQIVCLPNFTDVRRFTPSYQPSDYCVYLGRLSEEKGLLTLLQAMQDLGKGKLLVLGEGPLRPALEERIRRDKLDNVELLGAKRGEELQQLLRGARFSVIPSEWYENCPYAAIESFASGTPVVASDIGGLPEMVEDGENGLLFPPFSVSELRERMRTLFGDDELSARMGKRARARAERDYAPGRHLERLLELYRQAAGAPR